MKESKELVQARQAKTFDAARTDPARFDVIEDTTLTGRRISIRIPSLTSDNLFAPDGFTPQTVDRVSLPFASVREVYGYPSLYFRKTQRRLQFPFNEFAAGAAAFLAAKKRIGDELGPLLSSYDKEVVLPTTCALNYVRAAHFDLDEKGQFGRPERNFLFPSWLIDGLIDIYKKISIPSVFKISVKRGTNLGWPTQSSNPDRVLRDTLLMGHAALVEASSRRGMTLSELTSFLESIHGRVYAVAGERHQHSDRTLPVFTSDMQGYARGLQPRVRGIYFSPKYCVIWNRLYVKRYLKRMMSRTCHTQDRSRLRAWFTKHSTSQYQTLSLDASRFDQSVGGNAGRQILRLIGCVLGENETQAERIYESLNHEFSIPALVRTSSDLYISDGAEILSSGLSSTSILGSTYSECLAFYLASKIFDLEDVAKLEAMRGDKWDFLSWGDDMVFSLDKKVFPVIWKDQGQYSSLEELLPLFSDDVQMKFTTEPTLKFLGQNYDMLTYSDASTCYPVGRFFQQQFFPERKKEGDLAVIGFAARWSLLHPDMRSEVFRGTMRLRELTGLPFEWREEATPAVLNAAVQNISKDALLTSQADDVLNVFTHGLEGDDLDFRDFTGNDEIDASIEDLLGQSTLDITDLDEAIRRVGISDPHLLRALSDLRKGNLPSWGIFLQRIATCFGGSFNRNDCYY